MSVASRCGRPTIFIDCLQGRLSLCADTPGEKGTTVVAFSFKETKGWQPPVEHQCAARVQQWRNRLEQVCKFVQLPCEYVR